MEPFLFVVGLSALSMATTALFDLLLGPLSRWRKAAWVVVIVSLPLLGPILYHLRAPARQPRRVARRRHPPPRPEPDEAEPEVRPHDAPTTPADLVSRAEPTDRDHA
jgi:hypothetical protein